MGGGIGTVVLVVLYLLLGGDPQALFNSQQAQLPQSAQVDNQAPRDEASKFVAVVLADTEDAWKEVFRQMGREYQEPRLVLFTDMIQSGCGFASGATGPFYCPQDRRVYIDLGFFVSSRNAWVQEAISQRPTLSPTKLDITCRNCSALPIAWMQRAVAPAKPNLIGSLFGSSCRRIFSLVFGPVMPTGSSMWWRLAISKKRCARPARLAMTDFNAARAGHVVPDSFTHGSSEQRVRWFRRGYETGDLSQGDTFNAREL